MRLLIIDNFDSFTVNLFHALGRLLGLHGSSVDQDEIYVIENNSLTSQELQSLLGCGYIDGLIISPGPGLPTIPNGTPLSLSLSLCLMTFCFTRLWNMRRGYHRSTQ